jgi:hypothetical protein
VYIHLRWRCELGDPHTCSATLIPWSGSEAPRVTRPFAPLRPLRDATKVSTCTRPSGRRIAVPEALADPSERARRNWWPWCRCYHTAPCRGHCRRPPNLKGTAAVAVPGMTLHRAKRQRRNVDRLWNGAGVLVAGAGVLVAVLVLLEHLGRHTQLRPPGLTGTSVQPTHTHTHTVSGDSVAGVIAVAGGAKIGARPRHAIHGKLPLVDRNKLPLAGRATAHWAF